MNKVNTNISNRADAGMNVRVAIYRRVATVSRVPIDSAFGTLDKQERAIQHLLSHPSRRNWVVRHKIDDIARSSEDPRRRGLRLLIEAARRREFDVLLVYSQDRLARGYEVLRPIVDELEACGVKVYDATGRSISFTDCSHALVATITAVLCEFEREVLRRRRMERMALVSPKRSVRSRTNRQTAKPRSDRHLS